MESITCKSNPNGDCKECMKNAPYQYCCKDECMEHEFCRGCKVHYGVNKLN